MTVKEIIITSCKMLQEDLLAQKINDEMELNEEEQLLKNELIKCFNFVQNEVATEYIPLVKVEEIASCEGGVLLSSLTERIAYVISLKNAGGENVKYKIVGNKIVFEGKAFLRYCYCPKKVEISSECKILLPERVLAYGVLREYYLLQGFASEASVFEKKFKNSLLNFSRKKSEVVMPKPVFM